ncbi:hypothetical protein [Luteimicrobium sp. DT211]|uniref:hypothetical protein n=1 Tax=Luteimicrobium sp. DT211 TaxID=3393412 RepID=UPI003CF012C3
MPEPSIPELAERLVASCGDVVGEVHAFGHGRWALVRIPSQPDPVKVTVDLEGLERYLLRGIADGAGEVWGGDVDDRTAAWRLASVNLWEEHASANARVHEIWLGRSGETGRRADKRVDPLAGFPRGDGHWSVVTRGPA